MTDSGYTAQTAGLNSTAPQYDWVSQQLRQIYQRLVDNLDAEGSCWGNDSQGQSFGAKYCGPAVSLVAQLGNTHQGTQSMVDSICVWAKNYVNADQVVSSSASQLGTTSDTVV